MQLLVVLPHWIGMITGTPRRPLRKMLTSVCTGSGELREGRTGNVLLQGLSSEHSLYTLIRFVFWNMAQLSQATLPGPTYIPFQVFIFLGSRGAKFSGSLTR